MSRKVSSISLEPHPFLAGEVEAEGLTITSELQDELPHLVFLISGIRTNGWWAQEARVQELLWDGREVVFVPVRGNGGGTGRISSFHLITRLGLAGFRESFVKQIVTVAAKYPHASLNVFAHSMGSSLFAELMPNIRKKYPDLNINTVAFIGSVCHRRHSEVLFSNSALFVNDVGNKDYLPFLASTARPDSYSDVGFSGFLDSFTLDRFFSHDHTSCTSFDHIKEYLVPLISKEEVRPLGVIMAKPRFQNLTTYIRRAIIGIAAISLAWLAVYIIPL